MTPFAPGCGELMSVSMVPVEEDAAGSLDDASPSSVSVTLCTPKTPFGSCSELTPYRFSYVRPVLSRTCRSVMRNAAGSDRAREVPHNSMNAAVALNGAGEVVLILHSDWRGAAVPKKDG